MHRRLRFRHHTSDKKLTHLSRGTGALVAPGARDRNKVGKSPVAGGEKRRRMCARTAFFETDNSLWSWWLINISVDGIVQGIQVVLNLALVMVLSNVLLATTSPLDSLIVSHSIF